MGLSFSIFFNFIEICFSRINVKAMIAINKSGVIKFKCENHPQILKANPSCFKTLSPFWVASKITRISPLMFWFCSTVMKFSQMWRMWNESSRVSDHMLTFLLQCHHKQIIQFTFLFRQISFISLYTIHNWFNFMSFAHKCLACIRSVLNSTALVIPRIFVDVVEAIFSTTFNELGIYRNETHIYSPEKAPRNQIDINWFGGST